jgi:hypothetical protein
MEVSVRCYTCGQNRLTHRPVREQILLTGFWRLAHAFGTPIPGWLVLRPLRHVTRIGGLTREESAELGGLLAISGDHDVSGRRAV